jgi:hypothetical protein
MPAKKKSAKPSKSSKSAPASAEAPDERLDISNLFGRDLMRAALTYALSRIPASVKGPAREAAEKAALDAIYGTLTLLDGAAETTPLAQGYSFRYGLQATLVDAEGEPAASWQLAAGGEGLCRGFQSWIKGDFGQT